MLNDSNLFRGSGGMSIRVALLCGCACLFMMTAWFTPVARADEWDEIYEIGKQQLERGEWQLAVASIQAAVLIQPTPDHQATTSNLKLVEYLPYYYLGKAYFFFGSYEFALQYFDRSLQAGAVVRTHHVATLNRLRRIAATLNNSSVEAKRKVRTGQDFERTFSALRNMILSGQLSQASALFDRWKRLHPGDIRLPVIDSWLQHEQLMATASAQTEQSAEAAAESQFRKGLDFYLLGQYQPALRAFRQAVRLDRDLLAVSSWLRKTEAEIERLRLDAIPPPTVEPLEPEIIERIITQTTAPVFVVTSPDELVTETRASEALFTGRAGDDQGIDRVEFTVNGEPLRDAGGQRVLVRPGEAESAGRFSFSAIVPLRLGENQIVIAAYDIDTPPHRRVEQYSIMRKKPLYQTATFAVWVGSFFALVVGGVVMSRAIKYRIAIVNKYNPYIAGSPIRNQEMFFGRERLLKRILNTVHNNSLMIHGPRRIGKTSLQHQLKLRLETLNDPEYDFIPIMIDLQGTSEAHFFTTLMEEIIDTCKPRLNGDTAFRLHENRETYSSRDLSWDLKTLLKMLRSTTDRKLKLVLLIDEVDELNKYSEQANQRLRSVFMKTFAEHLVAVMSGAHISKDWQSEGSPWYNFFDEIPVPPFEPEDAEALIKQPVAGIFSYSDNAVGKIIEYSECKPYIVQKFCVNVISRIIEEKRRRVTVDDVETIAAVMKPD